MIEVLYIVKEKSEMSSNKTIFANTSIHKWFTRPLSGEAIYRIKMPGCMEGRSLSLEVHH